MKCINCNGEMVEGYEIKMHNVPLLAYVSLKTGKEEKSIKACVCPKYDKIEYYTEG